MANNFIGSLTVHLQLATVNRRMLTRRLARHITQAIVDGLTPRSRTR